MCDQKLAYYSPSLLNSVPSLREYGVPSVFGNSTSIIFLCPQHRLENLYQNIQLEGLDSLVSGNSFHRNHTNEEFNCSPYQKTCSQKTLLVTKGTSE